MTTADPTHRTPEQHDAVRRRSRTLSLCGLICGVLGLVLLLGKTIGVDRPPAIFGVNLSFCAMMMGIGILFYVKGTPRAGVAVIASILAIVTGIAGPLVYARQSLLWHQQVENRELANAEAIVKAATAYARQHDGKYPASLVTLLRAGELDLDNLHSPFGSMLQPHDLQRMQVELRMLQQYQRLGLDTVDQALAAQFRAEVDSLSDYQYFGAGLVLPDGGKDPKATLPEEIIVATSRNAIMSRQLTVAFADGRAIFLDQANAESALMVSNDARTSLGFPAIRPPEAIQRGQKFKRQPAGPRD